MEIKMQRIWHLVGLVLLLLPGSGCLMNDLILEFNGRTIEVQKIEQLSFPRGLEITYFDGRRMKLNGREAITLNGKELRVSGSSVSHGGSQHKLAPRHKLVIQKHGKYSIVEQRDAGAEKSWWGFWR